MYGQRQEGQDALSLPANYHSGRQRVPDGCNSWSDENSRPHLVEYGPGFGAGRLLTSTFNPPGGDSLLCHSLGDMGGVFPQGELDDAQYQQQE